MLVKGRENTYLLPQDAAYVSANYEEPPILPRSPYDKEQYRASIQKLHKIQHEHDATILFPHDAEQFATLRTAPEFYE